MKNFPCTQCGACCKSIAGIDFLSDFDRGDGQCKYLDELTNLCNNYEDRPLLCNVDRSYSEIFHNHFTKKQYYEMNAVACNELQKKHGIDGVYKVKVE